MTVCAYTAGGAGDTHPIEDRRLDVHVEVHWGASDPRADHGKDYAFCSFRCLSLWAAGRADTHEQPAAPKAA